MPSATKQTHDARKAAEALFKPKPIEAIGLHPGADTETREPVVHKPRILSVVKPHHDPGTHTTGPHTMHVRRSAPRTSDKPSGISPLQHDRIRTLVFYGMTIRQVAKVYDVAEKEIERIVVAKPGTN
jgi:hypothetical protein